MLRRYIHALRRMCALLVLSALVAAHDAACTWRSYCGIGIAAVASYGAVVAEQQRLHAHAQSIVEKPVLCSHEHVNILVQDMCKKHGVTADVYCSEHLELARSHMCAIDAYAMPSFGIKSQEDIDGVIIIYADWAHSAEMHLQKMKLPGAQDVALVKLKFKRDMKHMSLNDPQAFLQVFTAILEHEVMHIKHRHDTKAGILAAISPCVGAVSYAALSHLQNMFVSSTSWTTPYIFGAAKVAAISLAVGMGMRWYRRCAEWQADEGIAQPTAAFAEILENLVEESESKWSSKYRFMYRFMAKVFGTHPLPSERANRIRERIAHPE